MTSSTSSSSPPSRAIRATELACLSRTELAYLEAAAMFGPSPGATRFFLPHVREELTPLVEAVAGGAPLPSTLSCFDRLQSMPSTALTSALTGFGLYQVAAMWKDHSPRQLARIQNRLRPENLDRLDTFLETRPEAGPDEHNQIEEIYLALTRKFQDFEEAILQVGLFFLAAAARDRFETALDALATTLATEHTASLTTYTMLLARSGRPGLTEQSYRALRGYLMETSPLAFAPISTPEAPNV